MDINLFLVFNTIIIQIIVFIIIICLCSECHPDHLKAFEHTEHPYVAMLRDVELAIPESDQEFATMKDQKFHAWLK